MSPLLLSHVSTTFNIFTCCEKESPISPVKSLHAKSVNWDPDLNSKRSAAT